MVNVTVQFPPHNGGPTIQYNGLAAGFTVGQLKTTVSQDHNAPPAFQAPVNLANITVTHNGAVVNDANALNNGTYEFARVLDPGGVQAPPNSPRGGAVHGNGGNGQNGGNGHGQPGEVLN